MPFEIPPGAVPASLSGPGYRLRPIREADAALDHEAVMESRDHLRLWEQSDWPEEGFSVEENRADLRRMEGRFARGESYAYTVTDPAGARCLGCVYLFPTDAAVFARSRISALGGARWEAHGAAVYLWVRRGELGALDRRLLPALAGWLRADWPVGPFLFVTNESFAQQVRLFEEEGLRALFRIRDPKAASDFLAYGPEGRAARPGPARR